MVVEGVVAGVGVPGGRVGVGSDGSQKLVKVLGFGAWSLMSKEVEELSLGLEQKGAEEEGVVAVVVESQVKQDLLDRVCHRLLCTAGQIFPAPHMGKSDCAHVPGGF